MADDRLELPLTESGGGANAFMPTYLRLVRH